MGNCLSPSIEQPAPTSVEEGVKVYTEAELKNLTQKFKDTALSFNRVTRGYINPKTLLPAKERDGVAITIERSYKPNEQALQEWLVNVELLRHNSPPNLVKLIAYGLDSSSLYIVSEDFPNGMLNRHIYRESRPKPLTWEIRLKIATGAAECFAFLHLRKNTRLYGSFLTASRIWLDSDFNSRVSYFDPLTRDDDELLIIRKACRAGRFYGAPPEYIFSGKNLRCDTTEMLNGYGDVRLVAEKIAMRNDKENIAEMIDPDLNNNYPLDAGRRTCKLIKQCIEEDPKVRPSMQQVLDYLNEIAKI